MTTPPKTEWRDEHGRELRSYDEHEELRFDGDSHCNDFGVHTLSLDDARFLLRVLPEAVGDDAPGELPPLLCAECGKPIEPIGAAVSLRFTNVNDGANWAQRYEHRCLPGAFHGGCAQAAFLRNAKTFNNPEAALDRAIVEAAERYATAYETCECKVAECDCEMKAMKLRRVVRAKREAGK